MGVTTVPFFFIKLPYRIFKGLSMLFSLIWMVIFIAIIVFVVMNWENIQSIYNDVKDLNKKLDQIIDSIPSLPPAISN